LARWTHSSEPTASSVHHNIWDGRCFPLFF
jgi:hypothetical protein